MKINYFKMTYNIWMKWNTWPFILKCVQVLANNMAGLFLHSVLISPIYWLRNHLLIPKCRYILNLLCVTFLAWWSCPIIIICEIIISSIIGQNAMIKVTIQIKSKNVGNYPSLFRGFLFLFSSHLPLFLWRQIGDFLTHFGLQCKKYRHHLCICAPIMNQTFWFSLLNTRHNKVIGKSR